MRAVPHPNPHQLYVEEHMERARAWNRGAHVKPYDAEDPADRRAVMVMAGIRKENIGRLLECLSRI